MASNGRPDGERRRVLVLSASPRKDGNSRRLAAALAEGAGEAGHEAAVADLNEAMTGGFLRDCRVCRRADGTCSIEDGYERLLRDRVAAADALVYATPLYWYGMAATLKNFFDRMVCYTSASHPDSVALTAGLTGKRSALLLTAEESYSGASLAVIAQLQEMSRYLHHEFVGSVIGVGNRRGEVEADPSDPVEAAFDLGRRLFEIHHSDYRVDTKRHNAVWGAPDEAEPTGAYEDV